MRPLVWCRQTEDLIVDGKEIGKDRSLYEPSIYPYGYLIKSVGIGSTSVWVDNLRPLFDAENENNTELTFQNSIRFISQDTVISAAATAVVSGLGTISSIVLSTGGRGYSTTPTVSIASTIGISTSTMAMAEATLTNGVVSGVAVTSPGIGYTDTNPPLVLITPTIAVDEKNKVSNYAGDSGVIVGFGITTVASQDQLIFDLFIPYDSYLREPALVGTAQTLSTLMGHDRFVVYDSNVGTAVTSITSQDSAGSNTVGIGKSYVDNVYEVKSVETIPKNIVGIATNVTRVFVNVSSPITYGSGISTSNYFGSFSWGRIKLDGRQLENAYTAQTLNGIGIGGIATPTGIHTSTLVERTVPLKYKNYTV